MIKTTIQVVDPERAAELLKSNHQNRNMTSRTVTTLARAMRNGEWTLNGEAIKLAEDGTVLDGQHRLAACVESGVPFETLVVEGLPNEAQNTMDSGRKRTTADMFRINGEGNANVLAATTRRAFQWDAGNLKFANTVTPTTTELWNFKEAHPSLRRSAEVGVSTNTAFGDAGATVTATAHHILHGIDQDTAAVFFARLKTGAGLNEEDPVLTLRNRLTRNRVTGKAVPFHLSLAFYIRAWNAVREGRSLSVIIHTADEPMVLPV